MNPVPEIDVERARELQQSGEATFLDIRDPASFAAGHIEGATHLTDANVESVLSGLSPDRCVVVVCYHGNSSRGGAAFLLQRGFQEVYSLQGGFEAWRATQSL
ncbi:MAG: thiosulfate sulfurtransferase GlpE [Planctomycetota bacterium]